MLGRRIEVRGTVQGVGFRPWIYRLARETGVGGRVRNDGAGVEIEAFGHPEALDSFLRLLQDSPPPAASIRQLRSEPIPAEDVSDFVIVPSAEGEGERRISIPPDLATCPDCLREIFDPADRRYGYAFTNCTSCGPRFTIARDVPYDRPATTMAAFEMCPDCRAEYERPEDRRFHAQPNACPVCGPRVWAVLPDGERLATRDPIRSVAEALRGGMIIAVKGIGGFHLACDATSGAAVEALRRRKGRLSKPFAVMVRDLATAGRIAEIDAPARALLESIERPIVLLPRRKESDGINIAAAVAPESSRIGLMLPYSPLHHLLMAAVDLPLVMTSGNLSEEPIARDNGEALARLWRIADLFLLHDREIATPCDDSVVQVVAGAPMVLRRSRGHVPRPVPLAHSLTAPVLACGAHLKNTVCLAAGDSAYLGPHVGDLETAETFRSYQETIERLERLVGVHPEVIAHDLHPQYLSTVYARNRPEPVKIAVQHHHAHVASAMAEHGLDGEVLGVVFDGTGYGTDGTAWGGELMVADFSGYERLATFRTLPLAGADLAIREVWRLALAALDDAFAGEEPPLAALPLFQDSSLSPQSIGVVRQMIATGLNTPRARGVGRWFDALGALILGRTVSRHEAEVATLWSLVADPAERRTYPCAVDFSVSPWEIDPRPLVRAAVADFLAGRQPATIAAKFHNTLAAVTAEVVGAIRQERGGLPVVLTGGCFQNVLLAERCLAALGAEKAIDSPGAAAVYLQRNVPPGDGGLALGQALVADAVAWRGRQALVKQGGL